MKIRLLFPALFFVFSASAQSEWNQSLRYDMHVKFHPVEHTIDAVMKLIYTNHSPDTLNFIWLHVWPNAYRNDKTLYSDQLLENGDTRFYFSSKEKKGYINHLDFHVDGNRAVILDHPEFIDVIKLILPKPLLPGDSITIATSFHLQIPFNYNGNGYIKHQFEFRNWYPEPAVYDSRGWHPMPFLIQGGAFHEKADFDVEIESPPGYRLAAGTQAVVKETAGTILYQFTLKNANSFAWVASDKYSISTDQIGATSGTSIAIRYYYTEKHSIGSEKIMEAVKKEIYQLSEWLGPFPYPSVSIVQATCMKDQDYSGLVCLGMMPDEDDWQGVLRRGLVAQWFQTMLLTDQRNQPWFSRGFIHYYERRLIQEETSAGFISYNHSKNNLWLRVAENEKTTQPVNTSAPIFSTQNDTLIPSDKAGLWLLQLQETLGQKNFDEQMHRYISQWQFGHPYPEDFKKNMDSASRLNLRPLFDQLNNNQSFFTDSLKRTTKAAFIFSVRNSERYNYIGLAPVPGYNRYDGFMLGALIHNINLPENRFEFLFTPLYAFGSKTLEGLGRVSYSWHPGTRFSKISIGLNGGRFDTDKATDSTGKTIFENFVKLVPYIRLDFKPSSPRSTVSKWVDFKTYLITEKSFGQFSVSSKDSLIHPNAVSTDFRYVNQLSFNLRDGRVLYPYGLRVEFQQSELFYRINLHADYLLNYP
ncbi:MAG TPA: M1 family metallopeptidase, partial [Puia sp.]|nr:M1 family metallopeptidase [Puia sp.]